MGGITGSQMHRFELKSRPGRSTNYPLLIKPLLRLWCSTVGQHWMKGLLRDHHQRFFVIEVMRAGNDIERRFTSIRELHISYFVGNEVSVLDSLIVRDLCKQSARRAIDIARSAPALMSHEHDRCACLCIEIDHKYWNRPWRGAPAVEEAPS